MKNDILNELNNLEKNLSQFLNNETRAYTQSNFPTDRLYHLGRREVCAQVLCLIKEIQIKQRRNI